MQIEPSNKIRNALRDFAIDQQIPFYALQQQTGLLRTLMIRNTQAGDFMVLLQFFETKPKEQEKVLTFLKNEFPEIEKFPERTVSPILRELPSCLRFPV